MQCPECGLDIDELNESQPVCPRCGADPSEDVMNDPMVQDAVEEAMDFAERELYEKPGNDLIN